MEYQKIIKLLDNTPNQPSKFRTRTWVGLHDESRGRYNADSQIKIKTSIFMSSLCDYSDACIFVSSTITVPDTSAEGGNQNHRKTIIIKNCAPSTKRNKEYTNR